MDKTDNDILALFMGGKFEKREVMTYGGKRTGKWTFDDDKWCYDDQLDYSTDWRWLMPVWYKFRDLQVDDKAEMDKIFMNAKICRAILNEGPSPEAAFKALVEAIKWYNTVKK